MLKKSAKKLFFIGCFILRRYLQAFVLSTKKCADDESCDPPEDSPRHITLREQSSHKASYFRLLQKISIKNHWNSITTEKLSFELQIFSIWTGGRKDFSSKICVNRSLCQFSAQLFSTPEWTGSYGALHRGHIFFCRVGPNLNKNNNNIRIITIVLKCGQYCKLFPWEFRLLHWKHNFWIEVSNAFAGRLMFLQHLFLVFTGKHCCLFHWDISHWPPKVEIHQRTVSTDDFHSKSIIEQQA